MYRSMFAAVIGVMALNAQAQLVSTFEDFNLGTNAFLNGSGPAVDGKFTSGNVEFPNVYETGYGGYWNSGWAYSSMTNDTTAGSANLYGSFAGAGNAASAKYAVGQQGSYLRINGADKGKPVKGLYVTNGTFAALSMKNGDAFAKKFGGATGNDPDYFVLTVKSYFNGALGADSVKFYLADFRSSDNTQDYIVKAWTWVDLSSLGNTDSLVFHLTSSDTGQFGMNTPAFFCIDDVITNSDTAGFENLTLGANSFWNKRNTRLTSVFTDGKADFPNAYNTSGYGDYWSSGFALSNKKDTVTAGYNNLYSSFAGLGAQASATFAVAQNNSMIRIHPETVAGNYSKLKGVYITNGTYAALSMKNGDAFAKKFGGASGNDSDWFKVSFVGFLNGSAKADTVHFYLADYRSANNTNDYIVKNWTWVDLSILGQCDSLKSIMTSSDVGQFGMNTPAFFCLDNFEVELHTAVSEVSKALSNSRIYPNPAKDALTVDVNLEAANVSIYDLNGRLMLSAVAGKGNPTISVASLQTGLYLVKIESNGAVAIKKLIKE